MKAHCGYCGEEMMGAVNRCWRCGHRFPATPAADGQPPIRRDPIAGPLDRAPTPSGPASIATAQSMVSEAGSPSFANTREATQFSVSTTAVPEKSASEPIPGWLRRLESPQADRWGTPFHSNFEPTASDRWRRRQNQAREWLRLVVGDPASNTDVPSQEHDTQSGVRPRADARDRLATGFATSAATIANAMATGSKESAVAKKVTGQLSTPPPKKPLADAAGALALVLICVSLLLMRFPLIAAALGAMALTLAAISQTVVPRLRTVALITLIVAALAAIGWDLSRDVVPGTLGPAEKISDIE
jgi:hypothetical protein